MARFRFVSAAIHKWKLGPFNVSLHWEKIPIKITVLAQYSCSIFIFLFILYCIQYKILHTVYKILYTEGYRKQVFHVRACVCVCVKMLQEYWASTVIFIGIFSQCVNSCGTHGSTWLFLVSSLCKWFKNVLWWIFSSVAMSRDEICRCTSIF